VSDRLTLAHALEEAKIERAAAEKIATEIYDAIHGNVATKADLQQLDGVLRADMRAMEARLGKVVADAKAEIRNWMLAQTFAILAVVAALHFVK
jgi:hypothetical protein